MCLGSPPNYSLVECQTPYDCEGWLYKFGTWFGARRRRHYVLADKNLYQYADNRLERLKGVLFLPGCRVQPLDRPRPATSPLRGQQNEVYHGFVLSLPGEHASLFDELDDSQYGAHSPLLNSDSTDGSPSSWGSAANSQRRRPGSPSILRRAANSATNLRRLTKHVQPGTSWPPSPVNEARFVECVEIKFRASHAIEQTRPQGGRVDGVARYEHLTHWSMSTQVEARREGTHSLRFF